MQTRTYKIDFKNFDQNEKDYFEAVRCFASGIGRQQGGKHCYEVREGVRGPFFAPNGFDGFFDLLQASDGQIDVFNWAVLYLLNGEELDVFDRPECLARLARNAGELVRAYFERLERGD